VNKLKTIIQRVWGWLKPQASTPDLGAPTGLLKFYFVLIGMVLLGVIVIFSAQLKSAVIINGTVKVFKNRAVLQHPEGGRIGKIWVTEGQRVKANQVILEIDNPVLMSTYRSLQRQLFAEQVRQVRLQSEMQFPAKFVIQGFDQSDAEKRAIVMTEERLFSSRRRNLQSQLSSIEQQMIYLTDEIQALTRTIENDDSIYKRNSELEVQGFVSKIAIVNQDQAIQSHKAELARAKQRHSELSQRSTSLIDDFQNNAAVESRACSDRILEYEEKLKPTLEARSHLLIRATQEGTLVNLTKLGPGSVLGAKETVVEIVPEDRSLVLEGNLPPDQVSFVKQGMTAQVNFQQLKNVLPKQLQAEVITVSADSVSQGAMGTYTYLVRLSLDQIKPEELELLRPGMPAEIHIQTGARSIYDYLSSPVTSYFDRSMREPN
jgi:HlyD family type I secretion membrane fusion protein